MLTLSLTPTPTLTLTVTLTLTRTRTRTRTQTLTRCAFRLTPGGISGWEHAGAASAFVRSEVPAALLGLAPVSVRPC